MNAEVPLGDIWHLLCLEYNTPTLLRAPPVHVPADHEPSDLAAAIADLDNTNWGRAQGEAALELAREVVAEARKAVADECATVEQEVRAACAECGGKRGARCKRPRSPAEGASCARCRRTFLPARALFCPLGAARLRPSLACIHTCARRSL